MSTCTVVLQYKYLVYELGVVVCDSVQAGVTEGAAQPGFTAQRRAAVRGEQAEIHPQNRLHEGQHRELGGGGG